MGYTQSKIRGINFSFLLAGFIFSGWALFCAWYGWPHGFHGSSAAGFALFAIVAIFFSAFPAIWARYPAKHPVNHELARYGKCSEISRRLDVEMTGPVERLGPFRFTATFLVYDSGLEFQLIPNDQIASAELDADSNDHTNNDPTAILVRTKSGRSYEWFSTWTQGRFNPSTVLARIRASADLEAQVDDEPTADPSPASQSPSTPD